MGRDWSDEKHDDYCDDDDECPDFDCQEEYGLDCGGACNDLATPNLACWIDHAIDLRETGTSETAWDCEACTFRHDAGLSVLMQCSICEAPRLAKRTKSDESNADDAEAAFALASELHADLTDAELQHVLDWLETASHARSDSSSWDEVRSVTSEWTCAADDAFSTCDSEFEVLEAVEGKPESAVRCTLDAVSESSQQTEQARTNARAARRAAKSAARAARYVQCSYTGGVEGRRGTVLEQHERKSGLTAEEALRMTELRRMLKRRFNLVIGHGRGIEEVERVAMVKQRQAIQRFVWAARSRAASTRAQGRSACRSAKAY